MMGRLAIFWGGGHLGTPTAALLRWWKPMVLAPGLAFAAAVEDPGNAKFAAKGPEGSLDFSLSACANATIEHP